jgi:hypothetical protein
MPTKRDFRGALSFGGIRGATIWTKDPCHTERTSLVIQYSQVVQSSHCGPPLRVLLQPSGKRLVGKGVTYIGISFRPHQMKVRTQKVNALAHRQTMHTLSQTRTSGQGDFAIRIHRARGPRA